MSFTAIDLFSYSVLPAVVIGWIRFSRIDSAYLPFLLIITGGLLNEIVSSVLIRMEMSNALATDIYALFESYLMCWLFYNLGAFGNRKKIPVVLAAGLTCIWLAEGIAYRFERFHSIFLITYAFIIVLLSIKRINHLLIVSDRYLIRQGLFWILVSFVFFYSYLILVEIFWLYGLGASADFRRMIYRILAWVNLVINIIYAIGLLCLPKKSEFSRPS